MDNENNASTMQQLGAFAPNGHAVRQNNSANSTISRILAWKDYILFSIILFLFAVIIGLLIRGQQSHSSVSPAPCPSCPSGWHLFGGFCYYFSTDERNWTSSQNFCSSYNASLATLETKEKELAMRLRDQAMYWIGLISHLGGPPWTWLNGQPATMDVLGKGENCTYLIYEMELKASVSRCSTEHRFICIKAPNFT